MLWLWRPTPSLLLLTAWHAACICRWKKKDFERAKTPGSANYSQYAILEESWWEQREWGVTATIDTLAAAKHPLAATLQSAVADLQPKVPSRKLVQAPDQDHPSMPGRCRCDAPGSGELSPRCQRDAADR